MWSRSVKALSVQSQTSHLPPNTSSSADRTMEISGADGLSCRQVWLRRATALPLPNLLLCHWSAPARPSHWPCRDPGSRTLCLSYHEPSLRASSVYVSTVWGQGQDYPWSAPTPWRWESALSAANAKRAKVKGPGLGREGVMAGHSAGEEKCDSFPKG